MRFDLVFEGSGTKSFAFIGAMEAFFEAGHTFGRLLGTSSGGVTATLLAAGFSPQESLEIQSVPGDEELSIFASLFQLPAAPDSHGLKETDIYRLLSWLDIPYLPDFAEPRFVGWLLDQVREKPFMRILVNYMERGGAYPTGQFRAWLHDVLNTGEDGDAPRRYGDMTLSEFFEASGRELTVIAADINAFQMLALNHRTAPDLPVVEAALMSISLPVVLEDVVWRPEWGRYRGQEIAGHEIIDGGSVSSFPIELFVSDAPYVQELMGRRSASGVIGFLVDEELPVPGVEACDQHPVGSGHLADSPVAVMEVIEQLRSLRSARRIERIMSTSAKAHDKLVLSAFDSLVVHLPAQGYDAFEPRMSLCRRQALMRAAREATVAWLSQWSRKQGYARFSTRTTKLADEMAARATPKPGAGDGSSR